MDKSAGKSTYNKSFCIYSLANPRSPIRGLSMRWLVDNHPHLLLNCGASSVFSPHNAVASQTSGVAPGLV